MYPATALNNAPIRPDAANNLFLPNIREIRISTFTSIRRPAYIRAGAYNFMLKITIIIT